MELRRQGKIEDRVFAETRLRRGVYGQRYDNGQRHDGVAVAAARRSRPASSPRAPRPSGTRPGMVRIKIPYGGITPEQLDVIAELAEEYSDGDPAHHHAPGRPAPLRPHRRHARPDAPPGRGRHHHPRGVRQRRAQPHRLPARRRVPHRGLRHHGLRGTRCSASCWATRTARTSAASSSPPSRAARGEACGLVMMHDFGAIARRDGGRRRRAALLRPLRRRRPRHHAAPGEAALRGPPGRGAAARGRRRSPASSARLGEKANRNRARIKFLVAKLGIDEFRRLVDEERAILPHDERWTSYLPSVERLRRVARCARPCRVPPAARPRPEGYDEWLAHQRLPPAPAGLRGRDHRPAARRPDRRSRRAQLARRRAQVRRRRRPHHGRAEHRAALGRARRTCRRSTRELRRDRPRRARRRDDRRRHLVPRHRHLQARHRVLARPGRRAAHAAGRERQFELRRGRARACGSRSAAASTRAASTTSPTSASSATAARSTASPCPHFQVVLGGRWRENAGSLRPRRSARCRRKRIPEVGRRHHRPLRRRARRPARASRTTSRASARRSWAR